MTTTLILDRVRSLDNCWKMSANFVGTTEYFDHGVARLNQNRSAKTKKFDLVTPRQSPSARLATTVLV